MVGPSLAEKLKSVQNKISAAALAAGRMTNDIHLVAVSKTKPLALIDEAFAAGQICFGENYVQELLTKVDARPQLDWHFIGTLQTNKVKQIIQKVSLIHSVDRLKLLEAIAKATPDGGRQKILLQLHIGEETTKAGIEADELAALLAQAVQLEKIEVCGLMALPPLFENESGARASFARVRQIFERCRSELSGLPRDKFRALSMGTSHDYESAILEGATHVRVGTSIFGERNS